MKTKLSNFRLSPEAIEALENEANRTGKSKTSVIEDFLLWRRTLGEEADAAVTFLSSKHQLPARKVIEFCVLKAAGIGRELPFSGLVAA